MHSHSHPSAPFLFSHALETSDLAGLISRRRDPITPGLLITRSNIVRTAPRRRDCHKRPHPERIIGRRLPYHEFSSGISLMDARLSDANGCSVALEFFCLSIPPMTRFSHGSGYRSEER